MKPTFVRIFFLLSLLVPMQHAFADEPLSVKDVFTDSELTIDENDALDQEQTHRKVKKICKLCVGCLAVTGRLFVKGTEITSGGAGATGATGATGVGGALEWAYIYNIGGGQADGGQDVLTETDVNFSTNSPSITSMLTHTPGTAEVRVGVSGTYSIDFSATGQADLGIQFGLYLNGTLIPGSVFEQMITAETQQITGNIITLLSAGDVLTLRNTTNSTIALPTTTVGFLPPTNASLAIEQISL